MENNKPKDCLDSVKCLERFFEEDMWYAKGAEWETEEKMLKYLKVHFKICKDEIKAFHKEKEE